MRKLEKERCMTDGEIVTSYKQAKFPRRQITILSQLNCMKRQEIKEILIKAGCDLKQTPKKRPSSDSTFPVRQKINWGKVEPELIDMYYDGLAYREMAEALGISISSISNRIALLGNQNKIVRRD